MPIHKMTTKRISYQQQQQHQHQQHHQQHHQHQNHHLQQRRPPDVEEALSSMLWTPYERGSITDTSSDDEDEQLNCQLKKSKSHYDYTSVPTTIPPLTPPPIPPLPTNTTTLLPLFVPPILQHHHQQPTNIVAYIATPVRVVAPAATSNNCLVSTTSAYYTTEDLCDPSVTTPLVPFSNLMLNANTTTTMTPTVMPVPMMETTAVTGADDNNLDDDDDDDDVDIYNDVFNNENTLAATSSSTISSSYPQHHHRNPPHKTRISYGRIPGLKKWWSSSNATTNTQQQHQSSVSSFEQSPPTSAELSTTESLTTSTDDAKQPPSYESLYKKPLRPLRQLNHQHHPQQQLHSLNKHLNIFKPVLETLKANVTTITQGRFTAAITRQDNNRVTNTRTIINHTPTHTPTMPTMTTIPTTAPPTTTTSECNNICNSESSSSNLVHSFTDNFQHEQYSPLQHVAATNVANEQHIINNNNNNNNNNLTSCITTIEETTQSETPIQQHYDKEDDEEEGSVLHQQQHYTHEEKHLETKNTKSKQNQEKENKQNNNFIICQQQQQQTSPLQQQQQNELREFYQNEESDIKMNTITIEMNEFTRDLRETERINCHNNDELLTTNAVAEEDDDGSLFYDSSSAISLTRSFEANTTYTVGLTVASDYCKYGLLKETRNCSYTNLTPNKCLAELERLYAEFRASENLREQTLRETTNKDFGKTPCYSDNNKTENMRLNVPASNINTTSATCSSTTNINSGESMLPFTGEQGVGKSVSETKLNPSTSSVFLTTTNSVTTLTNPCQRTPSLTIQVNQNPNNNNNNGAGDTASVANPIKLNQAIVNTTTNGVSVINCNYVNNINNNNLNNNYNTNNKSITNLCDIATNTNQLLQQQNNNSNLNLNKISKSLNHPSVSSDNLNNINHHQSVPKVLNNNNNDQNQENEKIQKNLKSTRNSHNNTQNTQVNVIQVNEIPLNRNNAAASSAPSSPQRTFTSTECQTDDISSVQLRSPPTSRPLPPIPTSATTTNNRDQRRRERRERRHLHHTTSMLVAPTHSHPHPLRHGHLERHSMPAPPLPPILHPPHLHPGLVPASLQQSAHNIAMLRPMLPDILHNHYPPPYSALPSMASASGSGPHQNGSPIPFNHPHAHHPHHHPPPPPPPATILGPPPPPAGTTLLTSVISTVPIPGATPMVSDGRFTLPLPIIRRSPSERSGKGCCGQWFAGPPLRALIAVVALGGVACALGGAALGATGLAGPPSSHFTAALLMIGVGVVLVTVSGAAWRMTAPGGPPCLGLGSSVDLGRCGRRPCSRGGGAPQGLLYPEFQHRPPPPSYQASMQEYRLRLLLLDRDRQNGVVRGSSPPPTYRSHAGSLLRAPLTTTIRGAGGITGGRCESSIGGSEYSFPPSYRSRNATPGTISSERSIETEPSGRLLANEDIPEPLSVEQLSEYNSLQQRTINSSTNSQKQDQKRNSVQLDSQILLTKTDTNLNSDKKDDLVTIVTITPQNNDNLIGGDTNNNNNNRNNIGQSNQSNNNNCVSGNESREQIEILAHL